VLAASMTPLCSCSIYASSPTCFATVSASSAAVSLSAARTGAPPPLETGNTREVRRVGVNIDLRSPGYEQRLSYLIRCTGSRLRSSDWL
jgi:hypothetical protein